MLKLLLTLFTAIFLWEHFGRINQIDLRPALIIGNCTEPTQKFFTKCGQYIARLSSYLYHMQLKEVAFSLWKLFVVVVEILLSPVWTIKGYIEAAYSEYGSPYIIYTGSALMLIGLLTLLFHYKDRIPLLRSLTQKSITTFYQENINLIIFFLIVLCTCPVLYYYHYVYPTLDVQ